MAVALAGASLVCALALWPARSSAEGALSVGVPPDVATSGVAIGWSVNQPSAEKASEEAMEQCRKRGDAITPTSLASLCTQVGKTFHDQCVAIAIDPEDGTPGIGWAVAPTLAVASEQALANCQATAGADRREYCKVSTTGCDGTAK